MASDGVLYDLYCWLYFFFSFSFILRVCVQCSDVHGFNHYPQTFEWMTLLWKVIPAHKYIAICVAG